MDNKSAQSIIKSFSIFGLFGTEDVHIDFDENIKIIIGENGLGKTQVLNIFYYLLTSNFNKLIEFPFEKVKLQFCNNEVEIAKNYILFNFKKLSSENDRKLSKEERWNAIYAKSLFDVSDIHRRINRWNRQESLCPPGLTKYADIINKNLSGNTILYFPTFRRVEEDLNNLGYDDEVLIGREDNQLIHFGMDDVQKRFNSVENRIDLLLKEGFTKISSEILSKLVKGFGDTNKKVLDKISENDINIILARVGDQISEAEKLKIREIVANKEASNTDNSLFYFIQALVDIYEKQKEFDTAINQFKKVCNSYLIGKKVFYDESNIKIYIKPDYSDEPLPLNQLSSGEKQIISIFSKIYLSDSDKRFIVLFDEPELSLSMLWQKQLLPDIVNSNKCDFLLAVTHSPFIFDNELDKYAVGLNEYITPTKEVTA